MAYLSYIVSGIAIVLAGIFALLQSFWVGFVYFVLGILAMLSFFWAAWLIYKYFTDFKEELEERFKFYRIEVINTEQISKEYFDENLPVFKKEFSKKVLKDKIVKWFIIAVCFACAISFILGMVFY